MIPDCICKKSGKLGYKSDSLEVKYLIKKLITHYKQILIYCVIAVVVGVVVGVLDTIFGKVLLEIGKMRSGNEWKLIPFLPVAGVVIMLSYRQFSKESLKGMTLVFKTGHGEEQKIPILLVPLVMIGTWITHLFGGSAGREGVAVQVGATVAHALGRKLRFPDNARVLLITGMAAGFAGLFQTPLAATFFALEVLVAGSILYEALLPALLASYVASFTSHTLGLEKFQVAIVPEITFSMETVAKLILIGVIFGVTGGLFAHLLSYAKKTAEKLLDHPIKRILCMGVLLSVLLLVFHMGRYSGLGTNLITASFSGGTIYWYDWILKILLTILTLAAGYQGGEVTPLFSIGAALGICLGVLLGLPPVLVAALGYAAVFGSATNTLLAPILIGVEVFGGSCFPGFAVVCALAYVCNGNKTIYTAQKQSGFFNS